MILKYNEFINERKDISKICQGDNLSLYQWDAMLAKYIDFDNMFTIDTISDSTLNRMIGKSYPEGCEVAIDDLRYLIIPHYDGKGYIQIGELVCNKEVADDFIYLFRELFKHKYPIKQMRLIDNYDGDDTKSMEANNTSAFNYRVISGTDKLSRHAYGMAIDINPLYNPCVRDSNVSPAAGERFADRTKPNKYILTNDDLVYKILHDELGFSWGGDWENCKDYQHYEK